MNILEREIPRIIPKIEALKGRIAENHPKMELINRNYYKYMAGYQGERKIDYYFSLMDQQRYAFYHGIRLPNGKNFFQIDSLVVSDNFIVADEIKNLSGTIIFDKKLNQFTQNETVITNPFSQVKLQKLQFVDWFQQHKLPPIPIDYLITMANPSTKIETPNGTPDQFWKLCYGHNLMEKIQLYEKIYNKEQFPIKDRKRLKKLLLKYHTTLDVNILEKFSILLEEIIPGVRCPHCQAIPMVYAYGYWRCLICNHKSKDAFLMAINDYFYIYGPTITNKQFREFTCMDSISTASRLLSSMNLQTSGSFKDKIYYAPWYLPESPKTHPIH